MYTCKKYIPHTYQVHPNISFLCDRIADIVKFSHEMQNNRQNFEVYLFQFRNMYNMAHGMAEHYHDSWKIYTD